MTSPSADSMIATLSDKLAGWRPGASGVVQLPDQLRQDLLAIRKKALTDEQKLLVVTALLGHAVKVGLRPADVSKLFKSGKSRSSDDLTWLWFLVAAADARDLRERLSEQERESLLRCALVDTWPAPSVATPVSRRNRQGSVDVAPDADVLAAALKVLAGLQASVQPRNAPRELLKHALVQAALAAGAKPGTSTVIAGFDVAIPESAARGEAGRSAQAPGLTGSADDRAKPPDLQAILRRVEQQLSDARREAEDFRLALGEEERRVRAMCKDIEERSRDVDQLRGTLAKRDEELMRCQSDLKRLIGAEERCIALEAEAQALKAAIQRAALEARDAVAQARGQGEWQALARSRQLCEAPMSELDRLAELLDEDARQVFLACMSQLRLALRGQGG